MYHALMTTNYGRYFTKNRKNAFYNYVWVERVKTENSLLNIF